MKHFLEKKNRFCQLLQMLGWLNMFFFVLSRFLGKLSGSRLHVYKYYLVKQPVPKTSLLPLNRGKSIKVKRICEEDDIISQFPRPYEVIQDRFKKGAKCWVAYKDAQFIGFIWILLDSYQEDEVRAQFILPPLNNAAWDFDVYVAPEYRMGMVFARLWDEVNDFLLKNKRHWTFSRISAFNTESLRTHSNLGAKSFGSILFICIKKLQITFATLFPYFHVSFRDNSIPQFYLKTDALKDS